MLTTTEKLSRLKNYGTRYEIVAECAGHETLLIAYTGRKSFRGLLDAVRNHGPKLVEITEASENVNAKREGQSLLLGNGWRFRFSGRTQREAILLGEHTFVQNV